MEKRVFPCVIPLAEPITKCFTTHRHADSPQGLDEMNQPETVHTRVSRNGRIPTLNMCSMRLDFL